LYIIITYFTGDKTGPMGFEYLPWRTDENQWETKVAFLLAHGNHRHVICYPHGYNHYGIHINWSSLYIDMESVQHPDFTSKIHGLKSKQ
jgi:hypothetical protein